jgi:nitrite reductase (NADH) small subunit
MNPPNGPATLPSTAASGATTAGPSGMGRPVDAETVCQWNRLTVNRGVCALVQGQAVAVFLLADGSVRALGNLDPCSGAAVLSRGLIGDVEGEPTVASPMYKQRFSLLDGRCLDADGISVPVHRAGLSGDAVWVAL